MKLHAAFFTALALTLALAGPVRAESMAAEAIDVQGEVTVTSATDKIGRKVEAGTELAEGDRLITGPGSTVEIEMDGGDRIHLDENSNLTIQTLRRENNGSTFSIFGLTFGRVRSFVQKLASRESKFEYHTKAAIAGVAGTDFVVEVPEPDTMTAYVLPSEEFVKPGDEEDAEELCSQSGMWEDGVIYLQGFDPGQTVIELASCHMATVLAGEAPGPPSIVPNELLFKSWNKLPLSFGAIQSPDIVMLNNVADKVSVPLITKDGVGDSLQQLDTNYSQGRSGPGGGSSSSATKGMVKGTATITIGP